MVALVGGTKATAPELKCRAYVGSLPYFDVVRQMSNTFDYRLRLVTHAQQHGLISCRRKKYQRKQDLAAVKAIWSLFQQISADTKDLNDILRYWPQAQACDLPAVQYTAREVRSGLQFLAFASRRSSAASACFAARIQAHLARCGVELRHLAGQTDNGSEFVGEFQTDGSRAGFPAALGLS